MTTSETAAPPVDWRLPEHRREAFLDFYAYHLKHRAHPGAVYYVLPYLRDLYGWTDEEALWFAFLNGNTQNPVTSLLLHNASARGRAIDSMLDWYRKNYPRLAFDTDRRYHKKSLTVAVEGYLTMTGPRQAPFWATVARAGFDAVWARCNAIPTFGRLSAFSYAEYLRVMGLDFDCDHLFLEDMAGSRSHRNGLCIVLGLDHLDWHSSNPGFDGTYSADVLAGLELEGRLLLRDMRARAVGEPWERDVSYFTLESTLCTYKGWHRPNRRYPNVYNDMLYDRIRAAQDAFPDENFDAFWAARAACLPARLRLEDSPGDPGLCREKQNHYRLTGEPIMMAADYPGKYENAFEDAVAAGGFGVCR